MYWDVKILPGYYKLTVACKVSLMVPEIHFLILLVGRCGIKINHKCVWKKRYFLMDLENIEYGSSVWSFIDNE